ncbi:MAG: TfoX/Sxy family protein [Alphaproteobacteria bacterium]
MTATERPPRKLTALKNIGARTAAWLVEVGIHDEAELRALGPVAAYRRLKHARPREVTLLALYAAYGALTDTHWNEIPEEIKADLRREAEGSRSETRRPR